jgi:hypothetical protein
MVRIRALPNELAVWKRLARKDAMTLSTWIRDHLNAVQDEPSPFAKGPKHDTATRRRKRAP